MNLAILTALGAAYVLVLAGVTAVVPRLRARGSPASAAGLSIAVGVAVFVIATTLVDALGAALRLDLIIGALPPEQAQQLQLVMRVALIPLYLVAIVVGTLAGRQLIARLGHVTGGTFAVPMATALFIVVSLPVTDLLHACYLQTTVALPSSC